MNFTFTKNLTGLFTTLFLFTSLYGRSPYRKDHPASGARHYSRQKEGVIGGTAASPVDNPSDNLFHIYLNEPLKGNERVYLLYDLDGVEDYTAVSRSVNDQLSTGGYLVKKRHGWAQQKERLSASWLKKGDNVIRFSAVQGAGYSYSVRNLAIEVQSGKEGDPAVVVAQPSLNYYNKQGYISGFLKGPGKDKATVRVGGTAARVWKGAFEAIVDKPENAAANWGATIEVDYPDGTKQRQAVEFVHEQKPDYRFDLTNAVEHTQKLITQDQAGALTLAGASISIPKGALRAASIVSVTALRPIDMPALDAGMVNVTRGDGGYRFLPHGTLFAKEAQLALDYDDTKVPAGYTPKDVRTYYFDEKKGHWIALSMDSVVVSKGKAYARTGHFTDMINAVIKVPESPEVEAYNSTSMKGIKAADPSKEVNLISPPEASSKGNASISYPIDVPAGRAGMQPQLSIGYNSGGGNGWLGVGWDISLPCIGIDTRWGVPRFDGQNETETYSLHGEQLSPVAHRGDLQPRAAEKQFFPRVEGAFDKIIRHGDNPQNYWWEVTDKEGTRQFYGGDPATGVDAASTLTDAAGNIAYWALRENIDLHGNFVRYTYTKVTDAGIANGVVMGTQLYITRISYTGYNGEEGKYTVLFQRDRDLDGHTSRKDVTIAANNGFKQVTADLLKRIDVQYAGSEVRHYELSYKEGAFYKTLLAGISQYDAAGNFFNQHTFDYYNDIGSGTALIPLAQPQQWVMGGDQVHGGMLTHISGFTDEASALSGASSSDLSAGVTISVGLGADVNSKLNSVGGSFTYTQSKSQGMLAMIDVNGDGLPDKLFLDAGGNTLYYRANLSGITGRTSFGDKIPIDGITIFQKDKTTGYTVGLEANAFGGLMAGANIGKSTTSTTIYFTEANGDQLPDIVKDGTVYFNHIDTTTGRITFTPTSGGTPSPIFAGVKISQNLVDATALETERQQDIDNNPLQDIVRMWQAPYSGTINVTAPVQLLPSNDPDRSSTPADGVRVAVQLKGTELWSQNIGPDDYSVHQPTGLTGLSVQKGDRIYFRIGSIDNGSYDSVNWAPVIDYANQDLQVADANRKPLYHFEAAKDFILGSPQTLTPPVNGQVRISGNFVKPVTTDDIMLVILHSSTSGTDTVWRQTYRWDAVVSTNILLNNVDVVSTDQYSFKVVSQTNVDWPAISWQPAMTFTSASDGSIDLTSTPIQTYAVPEYTLLASMRQLSAPYKVVLADTSLHQLSVTPQLAITPALLNPAGSDGSIIFSVKKQGALLGKVTMPVQNGNVVPGNYVLNVGVHNNDELYIEYHLRNDTLATAITTAAATIGGDLTGTVTAGLYTAVPDNGKEEDIIFGSFYRSWGQFAWNGNRDYATQPIDESLLKPSDQIQQKKNVDIDGLSQQRGDQLTPSQTYDAKKDRFIILVANANQQRWSGYDPQVFVKGANMSSSRMGQDDLSILTVSTGDGTGSPAVDRVSKVSSVSFTAGASAGGIGGSASISNSTSRTLTDFMDMNGDHYPDVVGEQLIQYTTARGGLSNRTTGGGQIQETGSNTTGVSLTGSGSIPTAIFRNTPSGEQHTDAGSAQTNAGSAKFSVSGNLGVVNGTNRSNFSYLDMNGDGLPDRVNSSNHHVALNLGYGFAAEEDWGFDQIQSGASNSFSGGAGLGLVQGNNSFSIGFSLSRSDNQSSQSLQDMNGDGLPDMVMTTPSLNGQQALQVRLNTGNGFSPEVLKWSNAYLLNSNSSATESGNLAFTVGFSIFGIKFTVNPSVTAGNGMSRDLVKMMDVNGDGYSDYVSSTKDDNLTVSLSTIGRTNLLKAVHRPMGASFWMDYKRDGNTYAMPASIWTLAGVNVYDGFAGDGPDTLKTTFSYEGGHFDRDEREFYGYKAVHVETHDAANNNAVYSKTTDVYSNDNYYEKGLLLSTLVESGDSRKYTELVNTYELKDIATGTVLPDSYKTNDAGTAFPALSRTEHRFYEGQPQAGKTTLVTYGYDAIGNVTRYTDFGDDGPDDDISAAIAYHNVPDKYILSQPKSILVTGSGKTYRKRESTIDTQTGDVKQIRQYLEDGSVAVTDMGYDAYGNMVNVLAPANAKGQRFRHDYVLDDQVHMHIVKATNSYGYSSTATFDYRFGELVSSKDLNGNEITHVLDDLGRIIRITGPYEKASGAAYTLRFDYHPDATLPWARTWHYDPAHPGNDLETVVFMDGLGRMLQTKKDGSLFQGDGRSDREQMIVTGRMLFDGLGRQAAVYYPVVEDKGTDSVFNKNFDRIAPALTTYDVLNRVLVTTLPDGSVNQNVYGFGSDRQQKTQFSKKSTDANGKVSEQMTSVRGMVTAHKIYTGKGDVWTSFAYDAMNQQLSSTDDIGAATISQYDMFGRLVSRLHPDEGLTQYTYDLADNRTRIVTANLQKDSAAITYSYDFDRVADVVYPHNTENNIHYTYGAAGASDNRAGRVVVQEDATGAQEFFYGPLGETVKNIRSIVIPKFGVRTYVTQWTYDTWNRMTLMIYPDSEVITYQYNLGGLLQSMSGNRQGQDYTYLRQLGYDQFEQRVFLSYGNGTQTTYAYEADRRRLQNLTTTTGKGRRMMDNVYTYDRVNNILNVANNAPVPSNNLMGGSSQYTYNYDDLYRLTTANGSYKGPHEQDRYSLAMEYNSVGGITRKTQTNDKGAGGGNKWIPQKKTTYDLSYTYGSRQPHAATHIGQQTYTYDSDGNQTAWKDDLTGQRRTQVWDEENRLRSVSVNGQLNSYVYDAEGDRVLKGQGSGQSVFVNGELKAGTGGVGNYMVYVSPYLVVRSGEYSKHYFIENQRIATRLEQGWQQQLSAPAAGDKVPYKEKEQQLLQAIARDQDTVQNGGPQRPADVAGPDARGVANSNGQAGGNGNGNGNGTSGGSADSSNNGNHYAYGHHKGNSDSTNQSFLYFYHPDHLGSTSYVTDDAGEVYEHMEYFAFGETFVQEHSNTDRIRYLFNGKELDEETGYYYYGARYYDPRTSMWQSVDAAADKMPGWSPYNYAFDNPVRFNDPDGNCPLCALVGAGVGALIGGGIEAASQLYNSGHITSWKAVGGSALQGAVTGGVAGLTGGASLMVTVGTSVGANVVGGAANNLIQGKKITVKSVATDAAVGAVSAIGGKLIEKGAAAIQVARTGKALRALATEAKESVTATGLKEGQKGFGTKAHKAFENIVNAAEIKGVKTEASFLGKKAADYSVKGSSRADVALYRNGKVLHVFDLKTGKAVLSSGQVSKYIRNVPGIKSATQVTAIH
jgi:RHS repeat-associated protein